MIDDGITFLGKHSYRDFRYLAENSRKDIGNPAKQKVIIRPPYSNKEFDFSLLNGEQKYFNRKLIYPFVIYDNVDLSREKMLIEKRKIINWLMNSRGKQKLYDDEYPGYFFLAEVIDEIDVQDDWTSGTITVTFDAYPFMIAELPEGNDIWDKFNFDLDVAQTTSFEVRGQLEIILYNVGVPNIVPEITASSNFEIIGPKQTLKVSSGVSQTDDFELEPGENKLLIKGNGSISFNFYKELI